MFKIPTEPWGISLVVTRNMSANEEMDIKLPASCYLEEVKKYYDDGEYVGENVKVESLVWCVASKIRNEVIKAYIPVWRFPSDPLRS